MELNPIFTNGAVLQAEKPLRIFGTGTGLLSLRVEGRRFEGKMDSERWCVTLPALPYGGPYELRAVLDGRESVLTDLWAGDVYVLGGQSNMQFKLRESDTREYRGDERVRLFSTRRPEPEPFCPEDGWVTLTEENAGAWSCIGYHVGRFLREHTDRMLGFVTCYQGAADLQSFLPDAAFEAHPEFLLPDEERFDMQYPWNEGHSRLYRSMVESILPFGTAGVVWYQGESNCAPKEAALYGKMLSVFIQSWREAFLDETLPFVIIQIADYEPRRGEAWRVIQDAQMEAARRIPFVKTVVSADVCETDLIHPTHKTELSRRAAEALEEFRLQNSGQVV